MDPGKFSVIEKTGVETVTFPLPQRKHVAVCGRPKVALRWRNSQPLLGESAHYRATADLIVGKDEPTER
jgi:hypothetical protein